MSQSEIKLGRPRSYRESMDEEIISLAMDGLFLQEIAVKWELNDKTLWSWAYPESDKYPSFSNAYKRAKTIIVSKLIRKAFENLDNTKFNHNVISLLLSNLGNMSDRRRPLYITGISSGSYSQRLDSIFSAAESGELSSDELRTLIDALKTAYDVVATSEFEDRLKRLEEKYK